MSWEHDARHAHFDTRVLDRLQWVMDWWTARGFQSVPLPWMVPDHCMAATRPPHTRFPEPATSEGSLAASGEQSLLWLDEQGLLPANSTGLIGWTPCFRNEAYDRWHHHYFLKAELFVPVNRSHAEGRLGALVAQVQTCWQMRARYEGLPERPLRVESTGTESVDIKLGQVELGSYGIRPRLGGRGSYLYGTALAEPRWTRAWTEAREP